jgi:hypothetical protein
MTFEELYSGFFEDHLELKCALKTVIADPKIVDEAIKNYQLGREQDLVYAEQALA